MSLRLQACTADERHAHWVRIVGRIRGEQKDQAWSHYLFRLVRGVYTANDRLASNGGYILNWLVGTYVDSALMLIRRELDQEAGTENLRNLLFDISENPTILNRRRYRAQWGARDRFDLDTADQAFDSFAPIRGDHPDADHVDPAAVKADLAKLGADAESLRRYAERTRAHRTPERGISTSGLTFAALHQAIADIREVVGKYYALLTQAVIAEWEPVPQYDVLAVFMEPWVLDRETAERAIGSHGVEA